MANPPKPEDKLYAGAINWIDPDYDERTGEVLRPIPEEHGEPSEAPSVAEHPPPETPTQAARVLIGWFAGALAFESVHAFASGSSTAATGYVIAAIVVAAIDYKLKPLLAGNPNLTRSLNRLASDARLWVGVAMLSLLIIALSPFVEQRRWPFSAWFQSNTMTGFTQQQVDEKIAAALDAERAKQQRPNPPLPAVHKKYLPHDAEVLTGALRKVHDSLMKSPSDYDLYYFEHWFDNYLERKSPSSGKPPIPAKEVANSISEIVSKVMRQYDELANEVVRIINAQNLLSYRSDLPDLSEAYVPTTLKDASAEFVSVLSLIQGSEPLRNEVGIIRHYSQKMANAIREANTKRSRALQTVDDKIVEIEGNIR